MSIPKTRAEAVKRATAARVMARSVEVIDLLDWIVQAPASVMKAKADAVMPMPSPGAIVVEGGKRACPVCAKRKKAKAVSMRKWRGGGTLRAAGKP